MEKSDQYFFEPEKRKSKEMAPRVSIRTFWGDRMLIAFVDFESNSEVPVHDHPNEQVGTVISGEFELTIGNETRHVKEGDTYIIPAGISHGAKTGVHPAMAMDIFHPVRKDYQY